MGIFLSGWWFLFEEPPPEPPCCCSLCTMMVDVTEPALCDTLEDDFPPSPPCSSEPYGRRSLCTERMRSWEAIVELPLKRRLAEEKRAFRHSLRTLEHDRKEIMSHEYPSKYTPPLPPESCKYSDPSFLTSCEVEESIKQRFEAHLRRLGREVFEESPLLQDWSILERIQHVMDRRCHVSEVWKEVHSWLRKELHTAVQLTHLLSIHYQTLFRYHRHKPPFIRDLEEITHQLTPPEPPQVLKAQRAREVTPRNLQLQRPAQNPKNTSCNKQNISREETERTQKSPDLNPAHKTTTAPPGGTTHHTAHRTEPDPVRFKTPAPHRSAPSGAWRTLSTKNASTPGSLIHRLIPHLLLLGALSSLQPVQAGSHSYRSLYSSLTHSVAGFPWFSVLTYVDDVLVESYSSETRRMGPRAPWMEKINSEEPHYWERESNILQINENVQRANVKIIRTRMNQTGGLHSLQRLYGCELRADGSIREFDQYAYDGQDLISFDKDTMTFTAAMEPARISADRWNLDWIENKRVKRYLEGECIEYLKKYLEFGKESLQRRVCPEVRVFQSKTSNLILLTCYAYGFYPREIEVKWVRNGVEMPWRSKQILPNPDGTYQAKTTVEIHEGDDERNYACQVEHSSLGETVTVEYVPSEDKFSSAVGIGLTVGVIFGVLLLASVIGGFVIWKRYPYKGDRGCKFNEKECYSAVSAGSDPGASSSSCISA